MWEISWINNLNSFTKILNQLSFGFFFYLILQWTILIGPSQKKNLKKNLKLKIPIIIGGFFLSLVWREENLNDYLFTRTRSQDFGGKGPQNKVYMWKCSSFPLAQLYR
jgi:hypothetical protein